MQKTPAAAMPAAAGVRSVLYYNLGVFLMTAGPVKINSAKNEAKKASPVKKLLLNFRPE